MTGGGEAGRALREGGGPEKAEPSPASGHRGRRGGEGPAPEGLWTRGRDGPGASVAALPGAQPADSPRHGRRRRRGPECGAQRGPPTASPPRRAGPCRRAGAAGRCRPRGAAGAAGRCSRGGRRSRAGRGGWEEAAEAALCGAGGERVLCGGNGGVDRRLLAVTGTTITPACWLQCGTASCDSRSEQRAEGGRTPRLCAGSPVCCSLGHPDLTLLSKN